MTKACTALAVTDDNQSCEAEALTALDRLRNAVDVDELFDQLFATIVVSAAIIATSTVVAVASATVVTTAGSAAIAAGTTTTGTAAWATSARSFCRCRSACVGSRSCLDFVFVSHLEFQSACACTFGERFHAAVEQETTTIENNVRYARCLCTFSDSLADCRCCVDRRAGCCARIFFEARCGSDRGPCGIVDDLRIDMATRTMDRQTGAQSALRTQLGANALTAFREK
jgi:hypothetical protein